MILSDKDYYGNNKKLKSANAVYNYTQFELSEYIKCSQDPVYFIENYVKIVSKDRGEVLFKLYPFQKELIKSFMDNRFTIAKIFRQAGKTETVCAFIIWFVLFRENKTCAILANLEKTSKGTLTRLKKSYESLPWFLQAGILEWNKTSITLANGSKVITSATTESGLRGSSVDLLFIDELAFVPNNIAEEFWAASWPTLSSGKFTKAIIVSTPKGYNFFHKMWKEAEEGINGFVPITTHWSMVPGRDQAWADEQLRVLKDVKYAQEVECAFNGSSYTLIDAKTIAAMALQRPIMKDEHLTVYKKPEDGRNYVMTVDPAEGKDQDSSAMIVFDVTEYPITISATYKNNKISPNVLPNIAFNLAKSYNMAHILVETNNSPQVAYILQQELEYENIVYQDFHSQESGFKMDKKTKRLGCTNFKDLVENQKLLINDSDLQTEISNFVQQKNGTYKADEGYHDDLVMCCVGLGWFMTTEQFQGINDLNLRKALREKNEQFIEDSLLPHGFLVDGLNDGFGELSEDQVDLLNSMSDLQVQKLRDMRIDPPTQDQIDLLKP